MRRSCCPQLRINSGLWIVCAHLKAGLIELGKHGELKIFEIGDELSMSLVDYVVELLGCIHQRPGAFAMALSWGSLISNVGKVRKPPYLKTIDWSRWHVFWVDQWVVARNHPDINYKLAKDGLLSKVPILPSQAYSIKRAMTHTLLLLPLLLPNNLGIL